jgi:hypothetical protein
VGARYVLPDEEWYEIKEVYYNEKDQPCGYADPCLGGESLEEIKKQIERFSNCLNNPILDSEVDFKDGKLFEDDCGK